MKKILFCSTVVLGLFLVPYTAGWSQSPVADKSIDAVVVVVNGQAITQSEINRRIRIRKFELSKQNIPAPPDQELNAGILENTIQATILMQMAMNQGVVPSESAIIAFANTQAARANLTLDGFKAKLLQDGVSYAEYLLDARNELAIANLMEKTMYTRVKITEPEIDRYLRNPDTGVKQEFHVKQIALLKNETDSYEKRQTLLQTAQSIRGRLLKGESFDTLAKQFSNTPDAAQGGSLGFREMGKFPQLFSLVLENMSTGGVSQVLENGAGYFLIKLEEIRTKNPEAMHTLSRHILIKVDDFTTEAKAADEIRRLHSLLVLNKERFTELATQFSQDISSQKGGDLGWVRPGAMVHDFERVMDKTAVNEISEPFRSKFGWHILQVQGRENRPLSRDYLRSQVWSILRQEKLAQATQDWMAEVRSGAFVEYKKTTQNAN